MKPFRYFLPLLLAASLLAGCGVTHTKPTTFDTVPQPVTEPSTEPETVPETTADRGVIGYPQWLLENMTLREKVGQLFIVRPDALDLSILPEDVDNSRGRGVTEVTEAVIDGLHRYPVGGIVLFDKNITGGDQVRSFNAQLQEASITPLFLSVDEEGGIVTRLAHRQELELPLYSSAWDQFHHEGVEGVREMGRSIGAYLKDYGFNMDFAPVADVRTNPQNQVIGVRAFSSDPWEVAKCAGAMADGLLQNGIIPVYKHFPGHGDTRDDSHAGAALSDRSLEELDSCEWIPFRQAMEGECIMVGHITLPELENVPATLSKTLVTGALKGSLGFRGLVITDSMSMGAITQNYSTREAVLGALQAGCDLILMPYRLDEAFEAVVTAVEEGAYPLEELDATVLRILEFKSSHHILEDIR